MKKINIDKEDFNKLFRLYYLIEVSKFRWIFSYDDYFLKEYLKYYKEYNNALDYLLDKYNLVNKTYKYNFANYFITIEEDKL